MASKRKKPVRRAAGFESVDVHGTEYRIVRKRNLRLDGEKVHAYVDLDIATIFADPACDISYLEHEVGHAAWYQTGFDRMLRMFIKNEKHIAWLEEAFMWGTLPAILSGSRLLRSKR